MAARRPIGIDEATRNIRGEIDMLNRSAMQSTANRRHFMRTIYRVLEDIYIELIDGLPECETGSAFVDRVARPVQQIDPALYGEIMRALRHATQNNIDSYKFDREELATLKQKLRTILETKLDILRRTRNPAIRDRDRIREPYNPTNPDEPELAEDASFGDSIRSIFGFIPGFSKKKSTGSASSQSSRSVSDNESVTSSLSDDDDDDGSSLSSLVRRAKAAGGWRIKSRKTRDTRKTNKSRRKLKRSKNKRKSKSKRNSKNQLTL